MTAPPPPPGAYPYGQPPHGGQPYGPPGMPPQGGGYGYPGGQPPQGQPPYGQPGMPPQGQPPYGQPPYGQPPYGQQPGMPPHGQQGMPPQAQPYGYQGQPGMPPQGGYPGPPAPPPPSGPSTWTKIKTIGGAVVLVVGGGLMLWGYLDRDDSKEVEVSDCLRNTGSESSPEIEKLDCSDPKAEYKVLDKLDGTSLDFGCRDATGWNGVSYSQRKSRGGGSFVLCLGPVK